VVAAEAVAAFELLLAASVVLSLSDGVACGVACGVGDGETGGASP
jgi:hypothetical protein